MGFRHRDGSPLRRKRIGAEMYHYGWVRPPETMATKTAEFNKLWHSDDELEIKPAAPAKPYDDLGHLKRFAGTHPEVMHARIATSNWEFDAKLKDQLPDWLRTIVLFVQPLTKRLRRWRLQEGKK